jgi:DNA polymerase III epsilon subunit-like protein
MTTLYLDTETNGYGNFRPPSQRLVQLAWIYNKIPKTYFIKDVVTINPEVPHTITVEQCEKEGFDFDFVFAIFYNDFVKSSLVVAHNLEFDIGILKNELKLRNSQMYSNFKKQLKTKNFKCTMKDSVDICKLKKKQTSLNYKFPKLEELYYHFYKSVPELTPHDALNDCYILKMCHEKMTETFSFDLCNS